MEWLVIGLEKRSYRGNADVSHEIRDHEHNFVSPTVTEIRIKQRTYTIYTLSRLSNSCCSSRSPHFRWPIVSLSGNNLDTHALLSFGGFRKKHKCTGVNVSSEQLNDFLKERCIRGFKSAPGKFPDSILLPAYARNKCQKYIWMEVLHGQ